MKNKVLGKSSINFEQVHLNLVIVVRVLAHGVDKLVLRFNYPRKRMFLW